MQWFLDILTGLFIFFMSFLAGMAVGESRGKR